MKKLMLLAVALALGGGHTPQDRAVGGAAIGGVTGATIGRHSVERPGGWHARRGRARRRDRRHRRRRRLRPHPAAASPAAALRAMGP